MSYQDFVARKLEAIAPAGLEAPFTLPDSLFPMQRDLVSWALRRGRAATSSLCAVKGRSSLCLVDSPICP